MSEKHYPIAIVIPAYKAQNTIEECLSSINVQSVRDNIQVIISNDNPGDDYSYLKKLFPKLNIKFLSCTENGGPGVARSRGIKECDSDYVAFIDADDVYYHPYALENMLLAIQSQPNVVQAQAVFVQSARNPNNGQRALIPHTEPTHPWSFGRLTNVRFLKENNIDFGSLRAMEDGEFQWKIRMLTENTSLNLVQTNDIAYVWKEGSEHSITRTGTEINEGIPLYNYSICQIGAALAAKHAIDFVMGKNPFNNNCVRFATEQMVGHYFTYYECLQNCPKFAKQNYWLSKWYYHNVFKKYCNNVNDNILESFYLGMFQAKASQFKHLPELTFKQWFDKVKTEDFKMEELLDIRAELPEEVINAEKSTGVLSENILDMFN